MLNLDPNTDNTIALATQEGWYDKCDSDASGFTFMTAQCSIEGAQAYFEHEGIESPWDHPSESWIGLYGMYKESAYYTL
jgi:hypothetical protein